MHDTEDKSWWCVEGRKFEYYFVDRICPAFGMNSAINPEKSNDIYAPDLIVDGRLSDLKYQNTPFFLARRLYGLDQQYAITFNEKDYIRYSDRYPDIDIYFWINWEPGSAQSKYQDYIVRPMAGIWLARFREIKSMVNNGTVPLHSYKRRIDDFNGNGKRSYLLDVRKFKKVERRIIDEVDPFGPDDICLNLNYSPSPANTPPPPRGAT